MSTAVVPSRDAHLRVRCCRGRHLRAAGRRVGPPGWRRCQHGAASAGCRAGHVRVDRPHQPGAAGGAGGGGRLLPAALLHQVRTHYCYGQLTLRHLVSLVQSSCSYHYAYDLDPTASTTTSTTSPWLYDLWLCAAAVGFLAYNVKLVCVSC
jgi:hypothetical protein